MIKINKQRFREVPLILVMVGYVLIQMANPFELNAIVSIGTWTIVLGCILLLLSINVLSNSKLDKTTLALYFLIFTIVISLLINEYISYSTIVAISCFLEIPIFICSYESSGFASKKLILFANFILSVFYIIMSRSPLAYIYKNEWGSKAISQLTLSYNNPNETAMFLFGCLVILVYTFFLLKNKFWRIFVGIDVIWMVYLIILTECRTILTVMFFFFVLLLFYKRRNISNFLVVVSFVLPIAYIFLLSFFEEELVNSIFSDSGRRDIYQSIMENTSIKSFFFGNLSIEFNNMHNASITIFATVGILGTLLFYYLLNKKIKIFVYVNECQKKILVIGLLCMVIQTATEAAYFTAGSAFAACFLSVYFLCLPSEI